MSPLDPFSAETFIDSLNENAPGAYEKFQQLLEKPVGRLLEQHLKARHPTTDEDWIDLEAATHSALSWLRKYLPARGIRADQIARIDGSSSPQLLFVAFSLQVLQRLFLWTPAELGKDADAWQLFDESAPLNGPLPADVRDRAGQLGSE